MYRLQFIASTTALLGLLGACKARSGAALRENLQAQRALEIRMGTGDGSALIEPGPAYLKADAADRALLDERIGNVVNSDFWRDSLLLVKTPAAKVAGSSFASNVYAVNNFQLNMQFISYATSEDIQFTLPAVAVVASPSQTRNFLVQMLEGYFCYPLAECRNLADLSSQRAPDAEALEAGAIPIAGDPNGLTGATSAEAGDQTGPNIDPGASAAGGGEVSGNDNGSGSPDSVATTDGGRTAGAAKVPTVKFRLQGKMRFLEGASPLSEELGHVGKYLDFGMYRDVIPADDSVSGAAVKAGATPDPLDGVQSKDRQLWPAYYLSDNGANPITAVGLEYGSIFVVRDPNHGGMLVGSGFGVWLDDPVPSAKLASLLPLGSGAGGDTGGGKPGAQGNLPTAATVLVIGKVSTAAGEAALRALAPMFSHGGGLTVAMGGTSLGQSAPTPAFNGDNFVFGNFNSSLGDLTPLKDGASFAAATTQPPKVTTPAQVVNAGTQARSQRWARVASKSGTWTFEKDFADSHFVIRLDYLLQKNNLPPRIVRVVIDRDGKQYVAATYLKKSTYTGVAQLDTAGGWGWSLTLDRRFIDPATKAPITGINCIATLTLYDHWWFASLQGADQEFTRQAQCYPGS